MASKTATQKKNVTTLCKHIEAADDLFQSDPTQWFEVNYLPLPVRIVYLSLHLKVILGR
jgi:hypothetical protein